MNRATSSVQANAAGQLFAGRSVASYRDGGALRLRETQFHADAVGIVEEELRIAGARHNALAEFDVLGPEPVAHALSIGSGKGNMVEAAGVLVFLLGATHHDAFAGFARTHQVHGSGAAGIEPVAREVQRRAGGVFGFHPLAIGYLGAFEITGSDRVVLESSEWVRGFRLW